MFPYEQWATQNLTVHKRFGCEWVVTCPNPAHEDSHPSCNFNVDLGVYFCHSCGYGGGIGDSDFMDRDLLIDVLRSRIAKMSSDDFVEAETKIIPESALLRYKIPHPYWKHDRHLNDEIISMFDLGYDPIYNAATIPERTPDGELIGVTRRFIHPERPKDRYRYSRGFKAAENLFGSWIDADFRTVALVEGAIDAMKIWQVGHPAFAIYGAQLSAYHIRLMTELGVRKVIWFGDGDEPGLRAKRRSRGYWEKGKESYRYHPETDISKTFVLYHVTNHQGVKDAGSMTDNQVTAALSSAEPYYEHINTRIRHEVTPPHIQLRQLQRRHSI
jgi:Toprim-like